MTKKIAIVGAGLAGLSVAYHLLTVLGTNSLKVILYRKPIEDGASKMASGLLHPFTAKGDRKALYADEAYFEAINLVLSMQKKSKIPLYIGDPLFKIPKVCEDKRVLSKTGYKYRGCRWKQSHELFCGFKGRKKFSGLEITMGKVILMQPYLDCLTKRCEALGAEVKEKNIDRSSEIEKADHVVYALGAGLQSFNFDTFEGDAVKILKNLQFVKGQVLTLKSINDSIWLKQSYIHKGYVTKSLDSSELHLGSTYEHAYADSEPDAQIAINQLFSKEGKTIGGKEDFVVKDCRAGIRVANTKTRLPSVLKVSPHSFVVTGLGSKGLLYHALLGKQLTHALLSGDDGKIAPEFFTSLI